ncbi:PAS domain-containing protein [Polyangium sp. 15x6]|uniref:hybrid sensor histidine kinase/response regulator n=1 Tax=Polyangium sp. 15x6 TaxID=3042687 RepID=UPI00249BBC42|nr:PAS domain-containing protein [Polyangium sp. 15x6]MDI3290434.1 PAS domain-containing protein [Polyangium sp. 15x6]
MGNPPRDHAGDRERREPGKHDSGLFLAERAGRAQQEEVGAGRGVAALRESEERFRLATEAIRGTVYDWDFQTNHVWRSGGLVEMLGFWPEEIPATDTWWRSRIHPEDLKSFSGRTTIRSLNQPVVDAEYRIRHRDGHWIWVWDHARLIHDQMGTPVRLIGCVISIDARKRAEQALCESEERFRAMADTVPEILFTALADGRGDYMNQRMHEYTGMCGPDDVAWMQWIHPDDLPAVRAHWTEVMTARVEAEPVAVEFRLRGKDGSYRWFCGRSRPIRNEKGAITKWFGAMADVHDFKAAQQALRESEEHLRLATEAGGVGTFSFDLLERQAFCSETTRKLLGLPEGEVFQRRLLLSSVHPEDRPEVNRATRCAFESEAPCRSQFRILRGGQEVRWIELMAHVRRDGEGKPAALYGALIDVTERKRLEEERDALLDSERAARRDAERANRLKDDFLAIVSHELRAPLNAILGWSDMLRRGALSQDGTSKALDVIERNAALLGRLMGDMLDMERIRVGKLKLDTCLCDLARAVDVALETMRPMANERQIKLERTDTLTAVEVLGDPARLQQIVCNLLSNAIKFSSPGGTTEVSLACAGSSVTLTVRDDGLGIRPDKLPHLFQKFRQADASSARRQGGLGLGLSIVKDLVVLHGGTVRAESEGIGRGATLIVELPLASEDGAALPSIREGGPCLEGLHVLVVDDEQGAREVLSRLLGEEGAETRTASSAAEALHVIRSGWPSVVLSELGLPGEDGFHLVRAVRSDELAASIPVVAVTAFTRDADRARALRAGFDGHVGKPIEPHRLFDELGRILGTVAPTSGGMRDGPLSPRRTSRGTSP